MWHKAKWMEHPWDCSIGGKRVWTQVVPLHSLSDKYPWERNEPPDPTIKGLNSTTTVLPEAWIGLWIAQELWYANKLFTHSRRDNSYIDTFPKLISAIRNANSEVQDFELRSLCQFLRTITDTSQALSKVFFCFCLYVSWLEFCFKFMCN